VARTVALIKKVGTELKSTKFAALATKIAMGATGIWRSRRSS
jgi:hypothetical protein